jgi:hypothetical protein
MTGDDAACWQAAKRLCVEYPSWLVIWVPRTGRYHAFRLSASSGAPGLADAEPAGLAAQIEQAERAASYRRLRPRSTGSP